MRLMLRVIFASAGLGFFGGLAGEPEVKATQRIAPKTPIDSRVRVGDVLEVETTIRNSGTTKAQDVVLRRGLLENAKVVDGSLSSTPLARDDHYSCLGNVCLRMPVEEGLLGNDFDLGPVAPVVALFDVNSEAGGQVQIAEDGSFDYDPPAGFVGTDRFQYTIKDENPVELPEPVRGSNVAVVTVEVRGRYWFVDNQFEGEPNGTLQKPFRSLHELQASDLPGEGDGVVLLAGEESYRGPLTLHAGQRLIGQGVGSWAEYFGAIPVGTRELPEAGVAPVIESSGDGVVVLRDNTIAGVEIGAVGGVGLRGENVGSLLVEQSSKTGSGGGVHLQGGGELSVEFSNLSASSAAYSGIFLRGVTGQFIAESGEIATAGPVIAVDVDAPIDFGQTTFTRIDVDGAPSAVRLRQVSGEFRVLGDQTMSLGGNASGGILRNCTGSAIDIRGSGPAVFQNLHIEGGGESAVILEGIQGNHRFQGVSVTGLAAEGASALHFYRGEVDSELVVDQWKITGKSSGTPAFLIEQEQGQVTIENSLIQDCDGDALFVLVEPGEGEEEAELNVRSNRVENASGSGAMHVHAEGGVSLRAVIEQNEFLGVAQGNANAGIISVSGGAEGGAGVVSAIIRGNRIDGDGVNDLGGGRRRGISLIEEVESGAWEAIAAEVSDNEIDDLPDREALFAETRSLCELFELTVKGNQFGTGAADGTSRYNLGGVRDGVFLEHDGGGGELVVLFQDNEVACSSAGGPLLDRDAILDVNADRPESIINLTLLGNLLESSRSGEVVLEADAPGAQLRLDVNGQGAPGGRNEISTGFSVLHQGSEGGITWEGLVGEGLAASAVVEFLEERNDFTATVDDKQTYGGLEGEVPVPAKQEDGGDP